MMIFHRILFAISCFVAFLAGAFSAGAQDIAGQAALVQFMLDQPISVLANITITGGSV